MNEPTPPVKIADKNANVWAMVLHLSQFANFVLPFAGIIAPIVIWQLKKEQYPSIDEHGRNAVNWMITSLIYGFICVVLTFVFIGFFLAIALMIAHIAFIIIASIKANDGVAWKYPMSFKFF